ncbi:major capsid protein [Escherichia coli]|nr:major capsid protein [Escherichia coli]
MSNLREYQNRIADIAKRSKAVLGWQALRSSVLITNSLKMMPRVPHLSLKLHVKTRFLRVSLIMPPLKSLQRGQVHWLTTPQHINLCRVRKFWPPATRRWKNCLIESTRNSMDATNKAMLESVAAEMMSVSDGVMRLPLFLAMILPVQLGAATADACTFIPVTRDPVRHL